MRQRCVIITEPSFSRFGLAVIGRRRIVSRPVGFRPVADGQAHALLIEPTGVVNTGDAEGLCTAAQDGSLAQTDRPDSTWSALGVASRLLKAHSLPVTTVD